MARYVERPVVKALLGALLWAAVACVLLISASLLSTLLAEPILENPLLFFILLVIWVFIILATIVVFLWWSRRDHKMKPILILLTVLAVVLPYALPQWATALQEHPIWSSINYGSDLVRIVTASYIAPLYLIFMFYVTMGKGRAEEEEHDA